MKLPELNSLDMLAGHSQAKELIQMWQEVQPNKPFFIYGPSSVGKSETARIIAREYGYTFELFEGQNEGVDGVRALKFQLMDRWKETKQLVLIDEVHDLHKAAQDALLELLHDCPKNICIVLTTTEPHRVNDTIKSRCCQLHYRLSNEDIKAYLLQVAKLNDKPMLLLNGKFDAMVHDANGNMRVALTNLQALLNSAPVPVGDTTFLDRVTQRWINQSVRANDIWQECMSLEKFDYIGLLDELEARMLEDRLSERAFYTPERLRFIHEYRGWAVPTRQTFMHFILDTDNA